MRAGDFLAALAALPVCEPGDFLGGRPLVVLSPHPDDESLGVGGLIAAACARGTPVDVVILTDGAQSHPRSTLFPPDRLVGQRKAEAAEAVERLGLSRDRLHHLDLPDTLVPTDGPLFDAAVDRLAAIVREAGASNVLVTWNRDPHCDHEAAAAMARALRRRDPALALWFYPIWGWHLDPETAIDEPPPEGWRIDIGPWTKAKHAAIDAHASQMTDLIPDDPEGFRFTPTTIAPFRQSFEVLFKVPA